ncbi:MAG: hypothetical protein Fur0037_10980 [Planctomycetota bacterium]
MAMPPPRARAPPDPAVGAAPLRAPPPPPPPTLLPAEVPPSDGAQLGPELPPHHWGEAGRASTRPRAQARGTIRVFMVRSWIRGSDVRLRGQASYRHGIPMRPLHNRIGADGGETPVPPDRQAGADG